MKIEKQQKAYLFVYMFSFAGIRSSLEIVLILVGLIGL